MKNLKYGPFQVGPAIDDFFNNFMDRNLSDLVSAFRFSEPAMNMLEEDNEFRIELAAPGLDKSDFEMKVDSGTLTVKVEKEFKDEKTNGKFKRREFNFSRFSRSFQLPETVNPEAIEARYENGVLIVHLPKIEVAKAKPVKSIEIK
jgi:HSP20 family protein